MHNLEKYIVTIPNLVSNKLCDEILAEYINCTDWIDAITRGGQDNKTRNCKTVGISTEVVINNNKDIRKNIDTEMFFFASNAIKEYRKLFTHCVIEKDTGYELLKYDKGCFYIQHTDSFSDRPRAVSCSFALNDDFEGGEFAFFDGNLKKTLRKGDAIMFPSNFMYPHQILPVITGTRYSIVTWFV